MKTQVKDGWEEIGNLGTIDLPQVEQLLQSNGLPFEDCREHINNFIGIFGETELIAIGGLENWGKTGLLRSVAVRANKRGKAYGSGIVRALHQRATQLGIETLYLLTESAEPYFHSLGYRILDREKLPPEITRTKQFQSLCPASAQAMCIRITADKF